MKEVAAENLRRLPPDSLGVGRRDSRQVPAVFERRFQPEKLLELHLREREIEPVVQVGNHFRRRSEERNAANLVAPRREREQVEPTRVDGSFEVEPAGRFAAPNRVPERTSERRNLHAADPIAGSPGVGRVLDSVAFDDLNAPVDAPQNPDVAVDGPVRLDQRDQLVERATPRRVAKFARLPTLDAPRQVGVEALVRRSRRKAVIRNELQMLAEREPGERKVPKLVASLRNERPPLLRRQLLVFGARRNVNATPRRAIFDRFVPERNGGRLIKANRPLLIPLLPSFRHRRQPIV